jgi:protein O-GlcNAc transferase
MNRRQRRATAAQVGQTGSDSTVRARATIADLFNAALRYHRNGRLAEAELLYGQILAIEPRHLHSLHNLGNILREMNRVGEAVTCYEGALALEPKLVGTRSNLAATLQDIGQLDQAISHYRKVLALDPTNAEIHNNLGTALQDQGRLEAAAVAYREALDLKPDHIDALANLGNAYRDLGQFEQAIVYLRRALALDPNHVAIRNCLGVTLRDIGAPGEAIAHYQKALGLNPDEPGTHCNLGVALRDQADFDQAATHLLRAIELRPDYAEAHNNLGLVFHDQARLGAAVTHFEHALAIRPDYPEAHTNLGIAFQDQGRLDEAMSHFERALMLRPDSAVALYSLATFLQQQGRVDEAALRHQQVLSVRPDYADAKFGLCMAQLPILYEEVGDIAERRAAYMGQLKKLCEDLDRPEAAAPLAKGVGSNQPFFLAYQGRNDRDLQALYGSAVCKVMRERYPSPAVALPPRPGEVIRVGVVSEYFRNHSVWKLNIRGWLRQLDRERFQIFGYHTGRRRDATTTEAQFLCNRFVQGPLPADRWREVILADAPHVLIYPEIGMGPIAAQLAAQRLAATQCNFAGHPETSGYPTLDYFLSSELMEPHDGQDHYTEKLIRLPNMATYYEPVVTPQGANEGQQFPWPSTVPIFWCGQSLFKYLPQFDAVFPRIAREVGDCRFIFIAFPTGDYVTKLFQTRLDRAFAEFGLRASDFIVVLPRLSEAQFGAAIARCDIGLDSIGWTGNNSTLEALAHDLPIVTKTGALMRGRHTMAILQMMGVTDTITETVDDYVATAARLARDLSWRMALRKRIAENKFRLYRDDSFIIALQKFLVQVTHQG